MLSHPRQHREFFATVLICAAMTIASHAQTFTTLASFDGTNGNEPGFMSLVQGFNGNFYGTTFIGGAENYGTVFEITAGGTLTTLYTFCSQIGCTDGTYPSGGLVLATSGNLYGTTLEGGAHGYGTVFEITPAGNVLTTLYSFCAQANCTDGLDPQAGLVLSTDGNFYGTTYLGGANNQGTVFKITPAGTLTTLHSFNKTDGALPIAGLVQGTDGNFYGTTVSGGANDDGTVFKVTAAGTLTTLHSFDGTDGTRPHAGLVQGTDGNFYGTTSFGGGGYGTVFAIGAGGKLTTRHYFTGYKNEGAYPLGTLVQGTDGYFWGTTEAGGPQNQGTVFAINTYGPLFTLHSFDGSDGRGPQGGLFQATNGSFCGTTLLGGAYGLGTVFCLSDGLAAFVRTLPTFGKEGATVIILGTNLRGATSVTFDGTASTFSVVSSSEIKAKVPAGAQTGTVQVTTPSGTLKSNLIFTVTPSTTTTLASSLNPSIYGQKVTFTATVASAGGTPTGKVNFTWKEGAEQFSIGSATLDASGVATLTRSNLNADLFPLFAKYSGDSNHSPSSSTLLNQVVQQTTSVAAITSLPNPSALGQAVTFTAKITSPTVTAKGPVTFTAGQTLLGTVELSGGKATLTTSSLPAGSTVVKVTYRGDSNIKGSSASDSQVVQP